MSTIIKLYQAKLTWPKEEFNRRTNFTFNLPSNLKILSLYAYPSIYDATLEALVYDDDKIIKECVFEVFTANSNKDLTGYVYVMTLPRVGTQQYTRHVFTKGQK